MTGAADREECLHVWYVQDDDGKTCRREPLICAECIRALAVEQWDGIARHVTTAPPCVLCGIGGREYCPDCAVAAVPRHRAAVRSGR